MPLAPPRPCLHPGCTALVRGGPRCEKHQQLVARVREAARGSSASRGYGARWQRLRELVLAEEPLCSDPYGLHPGRVVAATDVDHIIPRARGGTDARSNLRGLCHRCHSAKTAREDGRWGVDPGKERTTDEPRGREEEPNGLEEGVGKWDQRGNRHCRPV